MRISPISLESQIIISESRDVIAKAKLARTTDVVEVQKELLKEKNLRVLVALASNENLDPAVERELAKIGSEKSGSAILRTLADRKSGENE